MKTVGSPITRGQANEGINQIENAFKECGVDPLKTMKKMLNKKAFRTTVISWVEENTNEKVLSDMFEETKYVATTNPIGKSITLAEKVKSMEKENGGLFDYVADDITDFFGNVSFTSTESISGKVRILKEYLIHNQMVEESQNMDIYEEYNIGDGLMLSEELVKIGAISEPGSSITIYLKNKEGNINYALIMYNDERAGLGVGIITRDPEDMCRSGFRALFRN